MEFIAHSRTDVPRLIGLVGEMAGVLESFRDTNCQRMGCMQCRDDVCLSKLWGRLDDVLAKYHGEAEPTTPNESYWWCESCGCEVDGTRVTYEELHDVCGHPVEWREGDDER